MKPRTQYSLFALGAGGMAAFLLATEPRDLDMALLDDADGVGLVGSALDGELIYHAAGCASCHSAQDTDALSGGKSFISAFGTFYAPNISTHLENGIGEWSTYDLANAIMAGVSPDGAHYYPAFPYTTYAKMDVQDTVDLIAYLRSLPEDASPSRDHDVGFPFNIRRLLGGWKMLFASDDWVVADVSTPELERGRYLVEALGHCAECHTPRNPLGGLQTDEWMRGAENPSGEGRVPSIHPDDLGWSVGDITYYLETGFTPDFDTAGGNMVDVVVNTAKLPAEDREAIAAYLVALP